MLFKQAEHTMSVWVSSYKFEWGVAIGDSGLVLGLIGSSFH